MSDEQTEGWGVMRPGDRRHHYYRKNFSLCGRVGFYFGHLDPDTGTAGSKDCAACRKKLEQQENHLPVGRIGEPGDGPPDTADATNRALGT